MSELYFVDFYYQLTKILSHKLFDQEQQAVDEAEMLKLFYEQTVQWPQAMPSKVFKDQNQLSIFDKNMELAIAEDMLENLNYGQRKRREEQLKQYKIEKEQEEQKQEQLIKPDEQQTPNTENASDQLDKKTEQEEETKESSITSHSPSQHDKVKEQAHQLNIEQEKSEISNGTVSNHSSAAKQEENQTACYVIDTTEQDEKQSQIQDSHANNGQTLSFNSPQEQLILTLYRNYACQDAFGDLQIQICFPGQTLLLLWKLWEIVICETPLMIVGTDPCECSHAILTLVSLISPLKTLSDFRPYLTIQNEDTKALQEDSKKGQFRNIILGISNPFLMQSFKKIPAALHFESNHFSEKKFANAKNLPLPNQSSKDIVKLGKEVQHALVTQEKGLMKPSRFVLKHLRDTASISNSAADKAEALAINNWIIRKHFREMTVGFLSSFNEFLKVNYALKGQGDHLSMCNLTKPFNDKEFLKSITKDNDFCKIYMDGKKDKTVKLYKKFIGTTLFRKYLNDNKNKVQAKEISQTQYEQIHNNLMVNYKAAAEQQQKEQKVNK